MTEQEITQARDDLSQLDIEQLRCGVMLQLLKIEALTKERDALMAAAKLAWVAIVELRYSNSTDKSRSVSEFAVQALREAGVQ